MFACVCCDYDTRHMLAFNISVHAFLSRFNSAALHADSASMAAPALVLVTGGLLCRSSMVSVCCGWLVMTKIMSVIRHCSLSHRPLLPSPFCLSLSPFLLNTLYSSLSHWEIISTRMKPQH